MKIRKPAALWCTIFNRLPLTNNSRHSIAPHIEWMRATDDDIGDYYVI